MCGGTSSSAGLTVSVVKDALSGESVVRTLMMSSPAALSHCTSATASCCVVRKLAGSS